MPKYSYTATTLDGRKTSGAVRADGRDEAEIELYERELRDITVQEKKSVLQLEISGPRIKGDHLMHLSRQLAAFLNAGLPILDAVHAIATESENSSVRRMMHDIEDGLRGGDPFSDCLDRHPNVFPEYYRGIVRSAELTGDLDTVLQRLARYLERDLESRRKIIAATIYPGAVALMSVFTIVVLAAFVLPKFKVFFNSLHAKLPLPTRMLLFVTDVITKWWWLILSVGVISVLVIVLALRTDRGQYTKDKLLISLPVVGETVQFALVERFCRVLGSMVNAGVQLPEALRVATGSLRNRVYIQSLDGVNEAMLEGQGLAAPLAKTALFPATAAQMLRVGEETGTMDTQLEVTAQYYETELAYKVQKLTSMFEPLIIMVMGGLVGFVAIALVSAMYGVFGQVKAG
jgi:type IV pilus assembly protein PilC